MHKKDYKTADGYFTVEASMIVPLIICLISFIFYLTFYLYNQCIVSQDAYLLAFRGSACNGYGNSSNLSRVCGKSPEEVKQLVIGQCKEQFGKKYAGIHTFISEVEADKKKVVVKVSGTMAAAFTERLLPHKYWNFHATGQAERICPTECIRKVRMAKKITNKISEKIGME